jgi:hypothetical protein
MPRRWRFGRSISRPRLWASVQFFNDQDDLWQLADAVKKR